MGSEMCIRDSFRDLAINYLGRHDLAHVKPEEIDPPSESPGSHMRPDGATIPNDDGHVGGATAAVQTPAKSSAESTVYATSGGGSQGGTTKPSSGGGVEMSGATGDTGIAVTYSEKAFDDYAMKYAEARMKGYEGDPCPECSSFTLLRNGSCLKCDTCGSTTGCS